MIAVLLAVTDIPPNAFMVVLAFGVLVGVFGHIIKSRTLILSGIMVITLISGYFLIEFLAQPSQ